MTLTSTELSEALAVADKMLELAGKATPAPWGAHDGASSTCKCCGVSGADHPIAQVTKGDWGDDYPALRFVGYSSLDQKVEAYMEQITYGSIDEAIACANAAFIAASRTAIPLLANAVKALAGGGAVAEADAKREADELVTEHDIDWQTFENRTELPEAEWPAAAIDLRDAIITAIRSRPPFPADTVEREKIAALLRDKALDYAVTDAAFDALNTAADSIEAGDHLKPMGGG